ncbi:hypothetical protein GM3708_464 [Geminocystis sp. NIES-3708]|uniref:hypothetical protein n=1 Tax=Geminocystis sp. NIES-3708 TaxID=1615909 RepID=UPI0005FC5EFC|nr:hypothetical protein [Geminocystis sp. NIES-3708]BAQ60058.1 hypothetical protein GM3708_464 [Geminocystis sp. NIES-3708]
MMNSQYTVQNEKTKIILGDAITVLNEYIENESIDLIFVDPPALVNEGMIERGKK